MTRQGRVFPIATGPGGSILRGRPPALLEAAKGFRRPKGCTDTSLLVSAPRARDQRLTGSVSQWRSSRRMSPEPPPSFQQRAGHPRWPRA